MQFLFSMLLVLGFPFFVLSDVELSRTITGIASDTSIKLVFDSGCKSSDAYGSNNCDFKWGSLISGSVGGKLGHDLETGSKFSVDLKVDKLISWKFTCALCGANCTTTIPVVDQPFTFSTPPCPIQAFEKAEQQFNATLPATSPVPVKVTATGPITFTDAKGKTVLSVKLDLTIQ
jgi:hypothetical protein